MTLNLCVDLTKVSTKGIAESISISSIQEPRVFV
jgi:hypothetical protein